MLSWKKTFINNLLLNFLNKKYLSNQSFIDKLLLSSIIFSLYSPIIESYFGLKYLTETIYLFLLASLSFFLGSKKIGISFLMFLSVYLVVIALIDFNYISFKKSLSIIYSVTFFYAGYFLHYKKKIFFNFLTINNFVISLLILTFVIFKEYQDQYYNIDTPGMYIFSLIISFNLIYSFVRNNYSFLNVFQILFLLYLGQLKIILFLIIIIFLISIYNLRIKFLIIFLFLTFVSIFVSKTIYEKKIFNVNSYFSYFFSKTNQLVFGDRYNIGIFDIKDFLTKKNNNYEIKLKREEFANKGSINSRLNSWKNSIDEFKKSNNKIFGKDYSKSLEYRHNFLLDILIEFGLLGLIIVLVGVSKFIISYVKLFYEKKEKINDLICNGSIVLFLFLNHLLSIPYYNFKYLALFLGLYYFEVRKIKKNI